MAAGLLAEPWSGWSPHSHDSPQRVASGQILGLHAPSLHEENPAKLTGLVIQASSVLREASRASTDLPAPKLLFQDDLEIIFYIWYSRFGDYFFFKFLASKKRPIPNQLLVLVHVPLLQDEEASLICGAKERIQHFYCFSDSQKVLFGVYVPNSLTRTVGLTVKVLNGCTSGITSIHKYSSTYIGFFIIFDIFHLIWKRAEQEFTWAQLCSIQITTSLWAEICYELCTLL